jgi:hypothetical protein
MSASASRRDDTDRSLARSAWESVPRKNRPVGYGMIRYEGRPGRLSRALNRYRPGGTVELRRQPGEGLKANRRSADVRLTPNYGGQPSPERPKAFWTLFMLAWLASRSSGVSRAKAGISGNYGVSSSHSSCQALDRTLYRFHKIPPLSKPVRIRSSLRTPWELFFGSTWPSLP